MNSRGILKLSRAEFFTHDWLFYFGVGGSSFKICGIYFRDDQSTAAGFDTFVILKLDRLWLVLVIVALYCGFSLLEM